MYFAEGKNEEVVTLARESLLMAGCTCLVWLRVYFASALMNLNHFDLVCFLEDLVLFFFLRAYLPSFQP